MRSATAPPLGSAEGVADAVRVALELGYRHVDTAPFYGNEEAVGAGIAASAVDPAAVFVTTKIWNDDIVAGARATRASIDTSRGRHGVEVIDLVLLHFCREHGIQHQGWSPLMVGRADEVPEIRAIAAAHGRTPFQVAIRWALQHHSVTIPKSSTPARIAENADVFGFELTAEQMATIDGLDRDERIGPDPEEFPALWA